MVCKFPTLVLWGLFFHSVFVSASHSSQELFLDKQLGSWAIQTPVPSTEHHNRSAGNQQRYKKSIFWSDKMKIPLFIGEYHSVHVGAKASTTVFNTFCKVKTCVSCHACSECRLASRMIYLFWWTMLCPKTIPSSWGITFLSTET